jgi:hypothetical protein
VREVSDGVAIVSSNAEQGGSRIIRGAEAEVVAEPDSPDST